jgi:maleate isomerase
MAGQMAGMNEHRWLEDPGWRGKVGFVSPPSMSMDPTEFLQIAPPGLRVVQTMTYVAGFNTGVQHNAIMSAAEQLEQCCIILKEAGADVIAQSGAPFAYLQGGIAGGTKLRDEIEAKHGVSLAMMGLSTIDAVKHLGCKSVAVACTYYNEVMADGFTKAFEDVGIDVHGMENWVQQGIFPTQEAVSSIMFPLHTRIPIGLVYKAARRVARNCPDADCIVISGGGISTLDIVQALEEDTGKPVVSVLHALFWDVLKRLGIHAPIHGYGSLLASLPNSR